MLNLKKYLIYFLLLPAFCDASRIVVTNYSNHTFTIYFLAERGFFNVGARDWQHMGSIERPHKPGPVELLVNPQAKGTPSIKAFDNVLWDTPYVRIDPDSTLPAFVDEFLQIFIPINLSVAGEKIIYIFKNKKQQDEVEKKDRKIKENVDWGIAKAIYFDIDKQKYKVKKLTKLELKD